MRVKTNPDAALGPQRSRGSRAPHMLPKRVLQQTAVAFPDGRRAGFAEFHASDSSYSLMREL